MSKVRIKVTVDRVALVKQVGKEEHGAFLSLMWSLAEEQGCKVWRGKHQTKARIMLTGKVPIFAQAGSTHGKRYLKIELLPGSMRKAQWDDLHALLCIGVEDGLSGIAKVGKISYIELAADCRDVPICELLPFDRRLRDSWRIPPPPEAVETYYLGGRKSVRHVAAYDKARELLVKTGVKLDHELTRIEMRQRNLGVRLAGVPLQGNPFSGLGVCRHSDARTISRSNAWHTFLDIAEQQGPQIALQWVGGDRALYLGRLRSVGCPWWNTAKVWKAARRSVTRLDATMRRYTPL